MRKIDTIIIHCLDVRKDWMAGNTIDDKVKEVKRWHTDPVEKGGNEWTDIGYHYVIDRDGKMGAGRPIERPGAHVYGYNDYSVGVALVGGHGGTAHDKFLDGYTKAQENALMDFIADMRATYPIKSIRGHNSYGVGKACPCFQVKKWLEGKETEARPPEAKPSVARSTSLKGNLMNIVSGGGLAAFGVFYQGLPDLERYIILGLGGVVLLAGLFLFRKKILKMADSYEL